MPSFRSIRSQLSHLRSVQHSLVNLNKAPEAARCSIHRLLYSGDVGFGAQCEQHSRSACDNSTPSMARQVCQNSDLWLRLILELVQFTCGADWNQVPLLNAAAPHLCKHSWERDQLQEQIATRFGEVRVALSKCIAEC